MRFSKVVIKTVGARTKVFIDGNEIHGVRKIEYFADTESVPVLKFEMHSEVELEFCGEIVGLESENK